MHDFKQAAHDNLTNTHLRQTLRKSTRTSLLKRSQVVQELGEDTWQQLRRRAHQIKKETIAHLDEYLEQLEAHLTEQGVQVFWAETAAEANDYIIQLAKREGASFVVKSKSMTTEEIDLNPALQAAGINPIETDLGEYIVQLAGERPSHITAPALHKSREDIARLFQENLGIDYTDNPQELTKIARQKLRQKFLTAKIGVSGVNFAIAENGTLVVIENEANARLCMTLPDVHVAVMGIEKVIPKLEHLPTFLRLLPRSATGQKFTSYVSLIRGAQSSGKAVHLVLLDNGRSEMLADPRFHQALYCIRCGACLNTCPVYQRVGGHTYGWVYPGPIGAILTPKYQGLTQGKDLPFASSLCGSCTDICPVQIDLHHLLLWLRQAVVSSGSDRHLIEAVAMKFWTITMISPLLYRLASRLVRWLPQRAFHYIPGWTETRDFPSPAPKTFREIWNESLK